MTTTTADLPATTLTGGHGDPDEPSNPGPNGPHEPPPDNPSGVR